MKKNSKHYKINSTATGNNKVWIFGKHPVLAALKSKKRQFYQIVITKNNYNELAEFIPKSLLVTISSTQEISETIGDNYVHQGIALLTSHLPNLSLEDIAEIKSEQASVIIALDQISDPHNMGAIIRTALAFNALAVISTIHNSADDTATVAKTSSGCIEQINLVKVTNLVNSLNYLKQNGYWIIGLDGHTDTILNKKIISSKTVLVLGSEEQGLRRLTKENCDYLAKININSNVESLNVSNAAAIALYEYSKNLEN